MKIKFKILVLQLFIYSLIIWLIWLIFNVDFVIGKGNDITLTQSPETLSGDGGTEDEVERLQQKSLMSQIDEPVVGICIGRSIGNQQAQEEGRADESKN